MHDDTDEHDTPKRPTVLPVKKAKGESDARACARTAIAPELGATIALHEINVREGGPYRDAHIGELLGELTRATHDEEATGTDRLMAQAIVLDRLFTRLTGVAMRQDYVSQIAPALTLALKAQAQCRQTLQAVSDIRHPRQYVGTQHVGSQFNAGGHMQVNGDGGAAGGADGADGTRSRADRDDAHADAGENRPTELSPPTEDRTHELPPHRGAPAGRARAHPADEAVGVVDRAANG